MSFTSKLFINGTILSLTVYLALGLANPIARIFLVIVLISIVFSVVNTWSLEKYRPVRMMFSLLMFVTSYFLMTWLFVGNDSSYGNMFGFYSNVGLALGIFFFGLYCALHSKNGETLFKAVFFMSLVALFYRFTFARAEIAEKTYGNLTLNMGYDFVSLLPYLFLFKRKWIPIAISPLFIYAVIMCIKRGAILITSMFFVYFLYTYFVKNEKKNKVRNTFIVLFLLICAIILASFFYYQNAHLQVRMHNMMEGDTNGRDVLFTKIFGYWKNEANVLEMLFGSGFCSSYKIAGNYAHNDWLELLSSSGVLGVVIYLTFFLSQYKYALRVEDVMYRKCICVILMIWLSRTFFSMSYCSISNMPLSLFFGYMVGKTLTETHKLRFYEKRKIIKGSNRFFLSVARNN